MNNIDSSKLRTNNYMESGSYVKLSDLFNSLIDNIVVIVIAAIIGMVFISIVSKPTTSTYYTATSKLYLTNENENALGFQNLSIASDLIGDYIAAFSNLELHEKIAQELQLGYSPEQLMSMVTVNNMPETHILNITVTSSVSAEEVQLLANTYAELSGEFFEEKFYFGETSIFEKAVLPDPVTTTSGEISPILGIFAGIIIASALIIVKAMLDERICVPEDIEKNFGIEVFGIMTKEEKRSFRRRASK